MNENSAARGGLLDDQNSSATRMNAQSEAATCALPEVSLHPLPENQHELLQQAAKVLDWAGKCHDAAMRPSCAAESRQFAEVLRGLACRTPEKLQVEEKPAGAAGAAGLPKLAKSDTVALWHAVNWMETVLREWHRGGFRDEQDRAQHEAQKQILINARKALRKVNKIRRGQP